MSADAELICKAAKEVALTYLNDLLAQIEDEWSRPQTVGSFTAPADPLELGRVDDQTVQLGMVDVVSAESNYPCLYFSMESESPVMPGESGYSGELLRLIAQVIVVGDTIADRDQRAYRWVDGIRRVLMGHPTLLGTCEGLAPPEVGYELIEAAPLMKTAFLRFEVAGIVAWGVSG